MPRKKKEKIINLEDIKCPEVTKKYEPMYNRAKAQMDQRVKHFETYAKISHMKNLYNANGRKTTMFSEGSTQSIKRKIVSQTLQRTPDGELQTQYDKNSVETAILEYLFENKILNSGYSGNSMFSNLTKVFKSSYDYGFACVRTGFKRNNTKDIVTTFNIIKHNNVFPNPDCDAIQEAEWYIIREWISRSEIESLFSKDDKLIDSTYNEDTLRYIIQKEHADGDGFDSRGLQDKANGVSKIESVEIRTLYRRGDDEFISYAPHLNAIFRKVKNPDPQKDVPLHFLILDHDDEYALGASSVSYTLGKQQFADNFLTSSNNQVLLAENPPVMLWGNLTQTKIKMLPRSVWNMGTNPNATKAEKFPIETSTLNNFTNILEHNSSSMIRDMNIQDATIASDAHVSGFSATPQGVEAQREDKTISINTYQKNLETFFSDWTDHALRSYCATMKGTQEITVNEETRRKIYSIEKSQVDPMTQTAPESIINGNKIKVNFDELSADTVSFQVRTGSLIESKHDQNQDKLSKMIVPISQMLGALPDEDKHAFVNVLMQIVKRLLEEADIDVAAEAGDMINDRLVIDALKATMAQVAEQNQVQEQMAQQLEQLLGGGKQPAQMPQQTPQQTPPQQATGMEAAQPEQAMEQAQEQPPAQ